MKETRHNVDKVAVVRAPGEPTVGEGDQHIHLRRLFGTSGHRDLPFKLTLAPSPVRLACTLDQASGTSVERATGTSQLSTFSIRVMRLQIFLFDQLAHLVPLMNTQKSSHHTTVVPE